MKCYFPKNIPKAPQSVYQDQGWISRNKFLGSNTWLPFKEARKIARSLKLKNMSEWKEYCKSDNAKDNIPICPENVYKDNGWISWADFLGTRNFKNIDWVSYGETRKLAMSLELKSIYDWRKYCNSGKRPKNIPAKPERVYKGKGWSSWGDFFGTNNSKNIEWLPYEEAKAYVMSNNITSKKEWDLNSKLGKRPKNIPANPHIVYKDKGWISNANFFGSNNFRNVDWLSYEEAKDFISLLDFKNKDEYKIWTKTNKRPENIPVNPQRIYRDKGWISWGDFLGTGFIANQNRKFLSYEEARKFVRSLGLRNIRDWRAYGRSGKRPKNIPAAPERTYKDEGWISWRDFLGTNK